MHKRIVEAITLAITRDNRAEGFFTIKVNKKKTDGFWSMRITPKREWRHFIPHFESVGMAIGHYYGEGLWVKKTKTYIELS